MDTLSSTELLRIYHEYYVHTVKSMEYYGDLKDNLETLMEVMEFASWIATDPMTPVTQDRARLYKERLQSSHERQLQELEEGKTCYACKCLHALIRERVKALEDTEEDESEETQKKWEEYERWSTHLERIMKYNSWW